MRILIASTSILTSPPEEYGGLELISALRARCLQDKYDVYLACRTGSSIVFEERYGESSVQFIEGNTDAELGWKIRNMEFDLVIDDSWSAYAARLFPDRSIKVWHGVIGERGIEISRQLYRKGCTICGVSRAHAELLSALCHIPVKHIYNCIDIKEYVVGAKDEYVLFLGRIERGKGVDYFLEFCKMSGIKGILAGEDMMVTDPRYPLWVMRHASEYNVEYLGRVPHYKKIRLLACAPALFTFPVAPYFEVFGLNIVEALASGAFIIGSNYSAVPEIAGDCGVISNSLSEILDAVSIGNLIELCLRYMKKCRERASRFDFKKQEEQIFGVLG